MKENRFPISRAAQRFFPKYQKFLLVGHESPDTDCCIAFFLFTYFLELPITFFPMVFVKQGETYDGPVPDDTLVVHFDTGGIYDPDNLYFDHHFKDAPYPCAAEMVFNYFFNPGSHKINWWIKDLAAYARWVDAPKSRRRLTPDEQEVLDTYNKDINDLLGPELGRFELRRPGPTFLAQLINNRNQAFNDQQQMLLAWADIDAWIRSFEIRKEISNYITNRQTMVEKNGLHFSMIPTANYRTNQVRNCVQAWWRDRINVFIYQEKNILTDELGDFGVTLIGDADNYTGMEELQAWFYENFPELECSPDDSDDSEEDAWLHQDRFVLYVKPVAGLTMKTVFEQAAAMIRPKPEAIPAVA